MSLISLLILILMIVSMWKIFENFKKPGWAAIIPIYNIIVLIEIVGKPLWWIILLLVPVVNLVIGIIILNELAKKYKKGVGYTVGLIFLPFIFFPLLAFGK